MKKFIVSALIWLLLSYAIMTVIVLIFDFSSIIEVGIFTIVMLIAAPITISITKVIYRETGKITSTHFRSNDLTVKTNLPISEGVIKGPKFNIPVGFTVKYRNANHSPTILHYYGADNFYRGFIVDFGNGKVGVKDNNQLITNCSGNLQVKFQSPDDSTQSIGWN